MKVQNIQTENYKKETIVESNIEITLNSMFRKYYIPPTGLNLKNTYIIEKMNVLSHFLFTTSKSLAIFISSFF